MRLWIYAALALTGGVIGLLIGLSLHSSPANSPTAGLSGTRLENEKLQQEVRHLQITNDQESGWQQALLAWAPLLTGLGAVIAVGATLWKQASDLSAARIQLSTEHEKTRTANEQWQVRFLEDQRSSREHEQMQSLRRFDSNLSSVITNLGSESETLQVNAAAALATYLKPRYRDFHIDLLSVLTANLQLQPPAPVGRVLRSDLERLLRLLFEDPAVYGGDFPVKLDLSRAALQRLDVSAVDFRTTIVDVAFADMPEARLADAKLFRLRGREVNLERAYCPRAMLREARLDGARCHGVIMHDANLVSASLKQADLSAAQFQRASMQEAHLEGANLTGTNFNQADLANTYFKGAVFDGTTLRSIARGALRWRANRNFDDATRQALERIT